MVNTHNSAHLIEHLRNDIVKKIHDDNEELLHRSFTHKMGNWSITINLNLINKRKGWSHWLNMFCGNNYLIMCMIFAKIWISRIQFKLRTKLQQRWLDWQPFWMRLRLCELDFGGEGRGRKGLWRGKLLFASFKKTRERIWGVLNGFICQILKFP